MRCNLPTTINHQPKATSEAVVVAGVVAIVDGVAAVASLTATVRQARRTSSYQTLHADRQLISPLVP